MSNFKGPVHYATCGVSPVPLIPLESPPSTPINEATIILRIIISNITLMFVLFVKISNYEINSCLFIMVSILEPIRYTTLSIFPKTSNLLLKWCPLLCLICFPSIFIRRIPIYSHFLNCFHFKTSCAFITIFRRDQIT